MMAEAGFVGSMAQTHYVAIKGFWLNFWGAVIDSQYAILWSVIMRY